MDEKYKVAEGVSLTAKGIIYKPGAEIPADVLPEGRVAVLLKAKKIVEANGKAEPQAASRRQERRQRR